jgi:hypothetical protein
LFFENSKDRDLHKKIWNFNEVPVVITIDNGNVEILNGFHLLESGEHKGLLAKLGSQKLTDFSYFKLVTGKTWEDYQQELNNKNRVDYKLLSNINDAREQIIGFFPETDNENEERKKTYSRITNALLGKVIFVRYLIDRHVKIYFDGKSKERTDKEFCKILGKSEDAKRFFNTLADEKVLLNYANDIVIPLQMQHDGFEKLLLPCKIEDEILTDYANLFVNRFASNFEKIGKKFVVEIWHTNQIIGMFFTVVPETEYKEPVIWVNKQNDTKGIFQKIMSLGITKITDQLFIQKDIRGFEKEYFYIFKPNEKRLWHKAVGYLDVNEFMDTILRAGGKQE